MRKLDQEGFSLVEGLLLIIALALVVFVGYYVWHTQQDTNKTLDKTSKVTQSASEQPSSKKAVATPTDANLQTFLVKSCGSENGAAIDAMFANKSAQTVDTDHYKIESDYAIVNVSCTASPAGTQLTTEFLKFASGEWDFVTTSPEVGCTFLTNQGFPDSLKAPYCQNTEGSFIQ